MHLYLMRHGIAYERDERSGDDDSRPLTEEGIERTRAVAKALHKDGRLDLAEVWTSPLVRARQTAEIVAEILKAPLKGVWGHGAGCERGEPGEVLREAPSAPAFHARGPRTGHRRAAGRTSSFQEGAFVQERRRGPLQWRLQARRHEAEVVPDAEGCAGRLGRGRVIFARSGGKGMALAAASDPLGISIPRLPR
jgi:Histidine phosphatase superfamily (branch 1)